jgi:hypothetical protein
MNQCHFLEPYNKVKMVQMPLQQIIISNGFNLRKENVAPSFPKNWCWRFDAENLNKHVKSNFRVIWTARAKVMLQRASSL